MVDTYCNIPSFKVTISFHTTLIDQYIFLSLMAIQVVPLGSRILQIRQNEDTHPIIAILIVY